VDPIVFVAVIVGLVVLLLVVGTPIKPIRLVGHLLVKVIIGAVFLFFLNSLGNQAGIHVPINMATSAIAGILGIPGVAALAAINVWVL
jgi:inhibitor of the pro-sigma K processing machinery